MVGTAIDIARGQGRVLGFEGLYVGVGNLGGDASAPGSFIGKRWEALAGIFGVYYMGMMYGRETLGVYI